MRRSKRSLLRVLPASLRRAMGEGGWRYCPRCDCYRDGQGCPHHGPLPPETQEDLDRPQSAK